MQPGLKFSDIPKLFEFQSTCRGGRGLSVQLAKDAVSLLKDLSLVSPAALQKYALPNFSAKEWRAKNLPMMLRKLKRGGL